MNTSTTGTTVGRGFDPKTWDIVGSLALSKQLISGDVLANLADRRSDICVLTADLGRPTQVHSFQERHPQRYFNFGIAERNMVSAAAGMAAAGMRPYVSGYACFLAIIAAEQIRTDICYPNLPVRMLGTHSGIAMGYYGTSHHATEDISMLRPMANLALVAPVDATALEQALESTLDYPGPVYFRLGRGRETPVYSKPLPRWRVGGSARLHDGEDATVFATGICVSAALQAAEILERDEVGLRVIDMYSLKPLDREAIGQAARETGGLFTAEEHNIIGGLGSAVSEVLCESGVSSRLVRIGIPDEYAPVGPPTHLYRHYGIDGDGIAATVLRALAGRGGRS